MADHAWMEATMRRSARQGMEVLERATRRRVDWTGVRPNKDRDEKKSHKTSCTNINEAFQTVTDHMAQTTCQCKNLYGSPQFTEPSEIERAHVLRFHTHPAPGRTTPTPPTRRQNLDGSSHCTEPSEIERTLASRSHTRPTPGRTQPTFPTRTQTSSWPAEDFHVEVYPGTYAVSAVLHDSARQTKLVNVNDGESIKITFNL